MARGNPQVGSSVDSTTSTRARSKKQEVAPPQTHKILISSLLLHLIRQRRQCWQPVRFKGDFKPRITRHYAGSPVSVCGIDVYMFRVFEVLLKFASSEGLYVELMLDAEFTPSCLFTLSSHFKGTKVEDTPGYQALLECQGAFG